jgi:hypothetical protein
MDELKIGMKTNKCEQNLKHCITEGERFHKLRDNDE